MAGMFGAAARQAATLRETAHRPWQAPDRPWLLGQTWEDVLFCHWPFPPERLQELVPGFRVDTFERRAWLGVMPFVISGLRVIGTLPIPVVSRFPETNVRTYVTVDDKPGIYFFSLDTSSPFAVAAARRLYQLPYFRARMSVRRSGGWLSYETTRSEPPPTRLRCRYRGLGGAAPAAEGTLAGFLTERYCLYTLGRDGGFYRAEIHHPPWPLEKAEAEFEENSMAPVGLDLPDEEPMLHFSRRQDVVIWSLEKL